MAQKPKQLVRLKFQLSREQEQILWTFINDALRQQKIKAKMSTHTGTNDGRRDLRVTFERSVVVELEMDHSPLATGVDLKATLVDLSMGGCCVALSPDYQIASGTDLWFKLKETRPFLRIRAVTL